MHQKRPILNELPDKPVKVVLIVVAFNRPDLLQLQYLQLKKYLTEPFQLLVADNSTDPDSREQMQNLCTAQHISYLSLPKNPFAPPRYSQSHAAALNYVFKHYFDRIQADYIGLLDHDIFPIRPIHVANYVNTLPFYGMMQTYTAAGLIENRLNYLWPGLSFFKTSFLSGKKLNFMPKHGGDTGAGCYHTLYKKFHNEIKQGHFAEEQRIQIGEGSDFQADMYALIGDDWVHLVNASEWKKTGKQAEKEKSILQQIQAAEAKMASNHSG